jgi:Cu-Zn family superoxide dismutase
MKKSFPLAAGLLATAYAVFTSGCASSSCCDGHDHNHKGAATAPGSVVKQLVAVVQPTAGNKCAGVVRFTEVDGIVYIYGEISGLTPNQQHAMHIHEFGDATSTDATKAGGHYNPGDQQHGLPGTDARHAGDLGNIQADADGKTVYRGEFKTISMLGPKNPIIGRGLVIHAKPDDGGQPVGNAGPRIGFGTIGVANPKQ